MTRFAWDARRQYRAFADARAGVASIVGTVVREDAVGHVFGPVVVVVDSAGVVCDVEIRLPAVDAAGPSIAGVLRVPTDGVERVERLELDIAPGGEVRAQYESGQLVVWFGADSPSAWTVLGNTALSFGLNGPNLVAIVVGTVVDNPGGRHEADWVAGFGAL